MNLTVTHTLVDVALDTLGENELLYGILAMLKDYYFDEDC